MAIKTKKTYTELISKKCKNNEFGEIQAYLINPTPASIRSACIHLFEIRNSHLDLRILNRFFLFKAESNKLKEMRNFDLNKFKPVQNFIKGKTFEPSDEVLDLIAWLINFKPRPYFEYQKSNKIIINPEEPKTTIATNLKTSSSHKNNVELTNKKYWKYILISISVIVLILFLNHYINSSLKKNEQFKCLIWKDIQYVAISCNEEVDEKNSLKIVPINERLLKMKKVTLKRSDDIFDKNGKPLYWYYKSKSGVIEFFTTHGFHPINSKYLRPITKGVFDKYVPIHDDIGNSFVNPNTK